MKILQINVVYKFGSTGKIVHDLHSLLVKRGFNSIVGYGRGIRIRESGIYKLAPEIVMKIQSLYSKITGFQYKGCYWSTRNLIEILKKEKPDIVHMQCVNANTADLYKTLAYLKKNNIPTVITLHAEFMYTGGCSHSFDCEKWKTGCYKCPQSGNKRISFFFDRSKEQWNMLRDSYRGFNRLVITCVSGWLKDRASLSPFFQDKPIKIVYNGLDTSVFQPLPVDELRINLGLEDQKIVLHVTPDFKSAIKGGGFLIQLAKRVEFVAPQIKFLIIGFNGDKSGLPGNVIPIGFTKNQLELARYYSLANLTLITSSKETFSMVAAESLCCGTPVVGFRAGGPETISIPDYSSFVPFGDIEQLEKEVLTWLDFKGINSGSIAAAAHSHYSKEKMAENYIDIYKSLINTINT